MDVNNMINKYKLRKTCNQTFRNGYHAHIRLQIRCVHGIFSTVVKLRHCRYNFTSRQFMKLGNWPKTTEWVSHNYSILLRNVSHILIITQNRRLPAPLIHGGHFSASYSTLGTNRLLAESFQCCPLGPPTFCSHRCRGNWDVTSIISGRIPSPGQTTEIKFHL